MSVDQLAVKAIYQTSVGGVARIRAQGSDFLVREGDRLADGEVDAIAFFTPTIAWLRLRRRMTAPPGTPYRPVVWLLAGDPAIDPGSRPASLAIGEPGGRRLEVLELAGGEPTGASTSPPWRWQLSVEAAPRLFTQALGLSASFDRLFDLIEPMPPGESWIQLDPGFGTLDFRFTSRQRIVQAVADELRIPAPPLPPLPPPTTTPPWQTSDCLMARSLAQFDTGGPPVPPLPERCVPPADSGPAAIDHQAIERLWSADEVTSRLDAEGYDSGSRRDPFADLSLPRPWTSVQDRGQRPEGIAGLLIDDLEIEGLFTTPHGSVAEVRAGTRFFFVSEGDQLWDGDVERIDLEQGVTFKQVVHERTALRPFRRLVRRPDPHRFGAPEPSPSAAPPPLPAVTAASGTSILTYDPAGRRDPFRSPTGSESPPASPPSALSGLTCDRLTYAQADQLSAVLERAEERRERYRWDRRLAEDLPHPGSAWVRRYLDDVASAASFDLARLLGNALPGMASLQAVQRPLPAEMFAVLGDLEVIAGRRSAAAESYAAAERLSPGYEPLCGRLHDGKLYGVESVLFPGRDADPGWYWLTGYLLAWDPDSGQVLERHLLPALPESFAADRETLEIAPSGAASVRLAAQRLEPPVRVATVPSLRRTALWSGMLLATNLVDLSAAGRSRLESGAQIDDRLPLTPAELEVASRAAALHDPTQPWHPFWLGQALWAQGRRGEAETLWRATWEREWRSVPYYELMWMAAFHETYGQPRWADRAFGRALANRRRLDRAIVASRRSERELNAASFRLAAALRHHPDRRHLWWQRLRAISGVAPGDAFRAALWAEHFARRGDRSGARSERAFLDRARRYPFDATTRSAWLDYSLYLVVAVAAMLFARLALLGGRLARRRKLRRPRWQGSRTLLLGVLRGPGPELLAILLALHVTLSLSVLAASHVGYLASLPFEPGDVAADQELTYQQRYRLSGFDLLRAWLGEGVVKATTGSPARLIVAIQAFKDRGPGVRLLLAVGAMTAALVIALPVGLLLRWGRARDLVTRWIPGGRHARAGDHLRGVLVFGLFIFALAPLSWLALARAWGAVPAPGPVAANFFLHAGLEAPLWPPPPDHRSATAAEGAGGPTDGSDFERLCAAGFWSLLAVYPGAGLFWTLVLCALMISVSLHAQGGLPRQQRAGRLERQANVSMIDVSPTKGTGTSR